jgi:hypothetical protein
MLDYCGHSGVGVFQGLTYILITAETADAPDGVVLLSSRYTLQLHGHL